MVWGELKLKHNDNLFNETHKIIFRGWWNWTK